MASRRSSTASEKKRGKSMTRSKSPWSSFRFKKNKKEAGGQEAAAGGAEALRDYLEDDDTLRTIGKTLEALEVADLMVMDWALCIPWKS